MLLSHQIREMFGRISSRYDLANRVLSLGLDTYWRRRAVRALELGPGDAVVDICCGTGDLAAELARAVRPGRVVGVDFSPVMLDHARRKFPDLEYLESDACHVPLEENRFQAATIAFGPRNIADLNALWHEMARLVVPRGKVLSLELTRPRGLLGFFHGLYLKFVVPVLGGLISGDREAYDYLSRTISGFIPAAELTRSMRRAGLVDVRAIPLCGGIVTIHIGEVCRG